MTEHLNLTRRRFLKLGLAGATCMALKPQVALAGIRPEKKELAFHNLHTDERLRVTYWREGGYDRSALGKINFILRDFRTGDEYPMSPNLMDLLHDLQTNLRTDVPIEIISGYRSPKTNSMLADNSDGVARHSYHMQGLATDIRMSGVSLRRLQNHALLMRRGGVGFYPSSDFVHVDVGPVRRWG